MTSNRNALSNKPAAARAQPVFSIPPEYCLSFSSRRAQTPYMPVQNESVRPNGSSRRGEGKACGGIRADADTQDCRVCHSVRNDRATEQRRDARLPISSPLRVWPPNFAIG